MIIEINKNFENFKEGLAALCSVFRSADAAVQSGLNRQEGLPHVYAWGGEVNEERAVDALTRNVLADRFGGAAVLGHKPAEIILRKNLVWYSTRSGNEFGWIRHGRRGKMWEFWYKGPTFSGSLIKDSEEYGWEWFEPPLDEE